MGIFIVIYRKRRRWYLKCREWSHLECGIRHDCFTDLLIGLKCILRMRWKKRADGWVQK